MLIGINVVVWAKREYGGDHGRVLHHRLSYMSLREGRYWTLVTHIFHHADGLHLLMNSFTLYFVGGTLSFLAPGRLLFLYLASGIAGGLAHVSANMLLPRKRNSSLFSRQREYVIGCSGSVCGLLAYTCLTAPHMKVMIFPIPIPVSIGFIFTALMGFEATMMIYPELMGNSEIAHASHLGGAAMGGILWSVV
ncbi:hypothetical protein AAMO2058_000960400 [Amorphochlora amoebiformis]